mmetsp:Transcript_941/g.2529  ORF Transcript_941/g.2529 Transcript_941/m.2529 type:complete len:314 (-) Transcript_941:165-1106(-)
MFAAKSLEVDETRAKLHSWFSRHGGSGEVEIEARVREVDLAKFEELLRRLHTNKAWSVKPTIIRSADIIRQSGIRESQGGPEGHVFLRKERLDVLDVHGTDTHHPVRLQASSEKRVAPDHTPISCVRHKQRHTFIHKNMFKFELTEVKQGPSWEAAFVEDSEYEIEIEYCGQKIFKEGADYVRYLIDSFIGKVKDAARVAQAPTPGVAGRKRPRDDGTLGCGDVVTLDVGTVVELEPVMGYKRPPQDERLPADVAQRVLWVFSGLEPDANGVERAHIMSLPCQMSETESYPLFHFSGHVPKAAVKRRAANFDL